jgi:hypothetical protein
MPWLRPLACVIALAALCDSAHARSIRLRVEGLLRCPTLEQVRAAIADELGAADADAPELELRELAPGTIALRLQPRAGAPIVRTLEAAPDECRTLAYAVAELAASWSSGLFVADEAPITSPAASPAASTATPTTTVARRAPSAAKTRFVHLRVALSGGGSMTLESSPSGGGLGTLSVELGLGRRWAIGALVSATSPDYLSGFEFSHTPLVLYGRVALHAPDRAGVALLGGVGADVISVAVEPIVWLAARGEWPVWRGLSVFGELAVAISLDTNEVHYYGSPTPADLGSTPLAHGTLAAGVAWSFF